MSSLQITGSPIGLACLALFAVAYLAVVFEEKLELRKSVPVTVAAAIIWALVGWAGQHTGQSALVEQSLHHYLLDFCELFLFLLAAMTFINTLDNRCLFEALRGWLLRKQLSLRQLFWVTGILAFLISPVADNLTTALLMGAVVLAMGDGCPRFVSLSCINIVVGANAGGAFSPFGDITTLMVWQAQKVKFTEFFDLFVPAVLTFLVPAVIMMFFVEPGRPRVEASVDTRVRPGTWGVLILFLGSIAAAVMMHNYLHLPPVIGMMGGLGMLKLYSYFLGQSLDEPEDVAMSADGTESHAIDIFSILEKAEWDTLMFFYGVILCVGGLATCGFLALASHATYDGMGPTTANVLVGLLSALIDNIPVMVAVLAMDPSMAHGQWLLVTLTAGVGGSALSVGSAAGVALMGQARGAYTFSGHLRWTPVILLGYAVGVVSHLWINRSLF